jgi:oligopeptide transport system ATP-binding protein
MENIELKNEQDVLVKVEDLKKYFPITAGLFHKKIGNIKAIDGISFKIHKGETLGLVGESGCGKSTVGRTILRLYKLTEGRVFFQNQELTNLKESEMRLIRPKMQMIFQDPFSSLNPRMTARNIISEPLLVNTSANKKERFTRVDDLLGLVGLNSSCGDRYPHEFSGGQRQRIGIACALALNPEFIVCDEPIAALDVSIQAQVVNLLIDLQAQFGLTYLFISHDLSMIEHISHRVVIMYLGKIMEMGIRQNIFHGSRHPYTQALLSAVPVPDPLLESKRKRIILAGDVPSPANPPPGCRFNTRCGFAEDRCFTLIPQLKEVEPEHLVACHLVD